MKNKFWLGLFVASFFIFATPTLVMASEVIHDYAVKMEISPLGLMTVNERIVYDFGDDQKHGIFRTLPEQLNLTDSQKTLDYNIDVLKVFDDSGATYRYAVSSKNNNLIIKIGDDKKLLSGEKVYNIQYTINPAIVGYEDHDEFYWDVIGLEWGIPVEKVSAEIISSEFSKVGEWKADCFTGFYGSNDQNCVLTKIPGTVKVSTTKVLAAHEGLTVGVIIPKNIFAAATPVDISTSTGLGFVQNGGLKGWGLGVAFFFSVLLSFGVGYFWFKIIKSPTLPKPIITQFEPPEDLNPLTSGTLLTGKIKPQYITATLVYLATKGYLKLKNIPKEKLGIFTTKNEDFEISRVNKNEENWLNYYEKDILDNFFGGKDRILLSEVDKNSWNFWRNLRKSLKETLQKHNFIESPTTWKVVVGGLYCMFALQVLASFAFSASGIWRAFFVIIAILDILVLFSFNRMKKTKLGMDKIRYLLGLKEYIKVAEQARINFHNAPEKNAEHFEKLLPYAIVFGLTEQWAKYCQDILKENPNWYEGSGTFNSLLFISALNSFSTSVQSAAMPYSSSGSSFSGGGFSGGGGGGGGGGSW